MKIFKIIAVLIIAVVAAAGGWFFAKHSEPGLGGSEANVAYYQSPMHPWIKSDEPGNCTICGMKLTPVYEGEKGFAVDEDLVVLSSNAINVVNVQTAPARRVRLQRQLQVAGKIESDQTRYRVISAYVDGRIEELFVNYLGAEVREGEPLATIYSPAMLSAEREYLTVLNQTNLSASVRVAPEHERMVEAARQRLKRLGLTDEQIEQLPKKPATNFTTRVTAPMSGTVVSRAVYEGQYVEEGDRLFEIADFSTMWFLFDVYEQDLPWIKLGQVVRVTSPALGGSSFEGPITFIDPTINEATRSAKARVELVNPLIGEGGKARRQLYNNLYAEGQITLETEPVLAVPRSAVIHPGDQARVYVETAGGAYERRQVKPGRRGERYWEIREGLEGDEMVVTAGNLLIDSQAQIHHGGGGHQHGPAEHGEEHSPSALPKEHRHVSLTPEQEKAADELLAISSTINQGFAADELEAFNNHVEHLGHAIERVLKQFENSPLAANASRLNAGASLKRAGNLDAARESYVPFSNALAEFALAIRKAEGGPAAKVYKCPMYPRPGKTALWVQNEGPIRNPFYGSEMLDCGMEVK